MQEIDKIGEVEKGPIQVTTKHSINVNFDKDNHEYHAVVVVGEKDILLSNFNPIFVNDFTFEKIKRLLNHSFFTFIFFLGAKPFK